MHWLKNIFSFCKREQEKMKTRKKWYLIKININYGLEEEHH